ncbi:MAG: hypothetical protein EA382_15085 [Spirochaetaceae bacterium]|nr:MAG: hypothetical protein EA382_15085 [Spirochaetaceae bacterium]
MVPRSAGFLVAAFWSLVRFVLVLVFVLRAVGPSIGVHLNLLWLAGPALVAAALFGACAFLPYARRFYVPPLRLIAMTNALTGVFVVLSRSYLTTAEQAGDHASLQGRIAFIAAFAILAVDLLTLAALVSYRDMTDTETSGLERE